MLHQSDNLLYPHLWANSPYFTLATCSRCTVGIPLVSGYRKSDWFQIMSAAFYIHIIFTEISKKYCTSVFVFFLLYLLINFLRIFHCTLYKKLHYWCGSFLDLCKWYNSNDIMTDIFHEAKVRTADFKLINSTQRSCLEIVNLHFLRLWGEKHFKFVVFILSWLCVIKHLFCHLLGFCTFLFQTGHLQSFNSTNFNVKQDYSKGT